MHQFEESQELHLLYLLRLQLRLCSLLYLRRLRLRLLRLHLRLLLGKSGGSIESAERIYQLMQHNVSVLCSHVEANKIYALWLIF